MNGVRRTWIILNPEDRGPAADRWRRGPGADGTVTTKEFWDQHRERDTVYAQRASDLGDTLSECLTVLDTCFVKLHDSSMRQGWIREALRSVVQVDNEIKQRQTKSKQKPKAKAKKKSASKPKPSESAESDILEQLL